MRWLPLALLLGFAQSAQAQSIGMYSGHLWAAGSLTKLGESDYRFDFDSGWRTTGSRTKALIPTRDTRSGTASIPPGSKRSPVGTSPGSTN